MEKSEDPCIRNLPIIDTVSQCIQTVNSPLLLFENAYRPLRERYQYIFASENCRTRAVVVPQMNPEQPITLEPNKWATGLMPERQSVTLYGFFLT